MTARDRTAVYDRRLKPLLLEAESAFRRRDDAEVDRLLATARQLAPHRLDLIFNQVGRSVQTGRIDEAVFRCREILAVAPRDVDALTYLAHWLRFRQEPEESGSALAALETVRPERAADLRRIWTVIDLHMRRPASSSPPDNWGDGEGMAIVALGYALADDGSMRPVLVDRLTKTLETANAFPKAGLVMTGGVPRAERIEAEAMRDWLIAAGIDAARVQVEGYARDVVENIRYSRHILELLAARRVLIVTSRIDARRAAAAMDIVDWAAGSTGERACCAVEHEPGSGPGGDDAESLKIYRDALRAYGLMLLRSLPELVEL